MVRFLHLLIMFATLVGCKSKLAVFASGGRAAFEITSEANLISNELYTLKWSKLKGASSFDVIIAKNSTCEDVIFKKDLITGSSFDLDSLHDGVYFLCVYAHAGKLLLPATNNGIQVTLDRSNPAVTIPVAIETIGIPFRPNMKIDDLTVVKSSWSQVSGPGTVSFVGDDFPLVSADRNGMYEIKAILVDQAKNQTEQLYRFFWNGRLPASIGLVTISSSLTNSPNIPVMWNSTPGLDFKEYQSKLCTNSQCSEGCGSVSISVVPSATLVAPTDGTYYACVKAVDTAGIYSDWLASNPVQVDRVIPVLNSLSQNGTYFRPGENVKISFPAATDASGIEYLKYSLKDGLTELVPPQAAPVGATSVSVTIPTASLSTQNAKVLLEARDLAGNTTTVESSSFRIVRTYHEISRAALNATGSADGSLLDARFGRLSTIVGSGNDLYVSDSNTVRKVNLTTGTVSTIAGSWGVDGVVDGPGDTALFSRIGGMAVINSTLYLADQDNHLIRSIDIDPNSATYRRVSTVAGISSTAGSADGTGTLATFSSPISMTTDGVFLYVGDYGSHIIRKIHPGTKAVSTLAGTPGAGTTDGVAATAKFNGPISLTFLGGFIYVAESLSRKIRKVDKDDGTTTTLAGGGTDSPVDHSCLSAHFKRPKAITTDGVDLYVIDENRYTLRKITLSSCMVTTVAGQAWIQSSTDGIGTAATLGNPQGVYYANDKVYITDNGWNYQIRSYDVNTGAVARVAGPDYSLANFDKEQSSSMFDGAHFDEVYEMTTTDGNLFYFVQALYHTVRVFNKATNQVTTIAGTVGISGTTDGQGTAAQFNTPSGILKHGDYLYVSDTESHTIRRIDLNNNYNVVTIAGAPNVYASTNGDGTAARFRKPFGLATNGTEIFIADGVNHRIRKMTIAAPHSVTTVAGSVIGDADGNGTAAQFYSPRFLALDGTNLYVSQELHTIRKVDLANSNAVSTVAGVYGSAGIVDGTLGTNKFANPRGLAVKDGILYIADYNNNRIRKMNLSSGEVSTLAGTYASSSGVGYGLRAPATKVLSLTIWGSKIYYGSLGIRSYNLTSDMSVPEAGSSSNNFVVNRLTAAANDGQALKNVGPRYDGFLSDPSSNYLYSWDKANFVLKRTDLHGANETVIAGAYGEPGFTDGAFPNNRIGRINAAVLGNGFLYFADETSNTVRRLNLSTTTVDTIAGKAGFQGSADGVGTAATFMGISSLSYANNNIFIADQLSHTIRVLSVDAATFGTVTTLTGTTGLSGYADGSLAAATFNAPNSLTFLDNKIYVAETNNGIVRVIDLSIDNVGTLVGDRSSLVDTGKKSCSTQEGSGYSAKFCDIEGLTVDAASRLLYLTEPRKGLVWKISVDGGSASIFAGIKNQTRDVIGGDILTAPISYPLSIHYSESGGLYFFNGYGIKKLE